MKTQLSFAFSDPNNAYLCEELLSEQFSSDKVFSYVYTNGDSKELFVECDDEQYDYIFWRVAKNYDLELNETLVYENSGILATRAYKALDKKLKKAVDRTLTHWDKLGDSKLQKAIEKASKEINVGQKEITDFMAKAIFNEDLEYILHEKEDEDKNKDDKKQEKTEKKDKEKASVKDPANKTEKNKAADKAPTPMMGKPEPTFKNFDVGGKAVAVKPSATDTEKEKLSPPIKGNPLEKTPSDDIST